MNKAEKITLKGVKYSIHQSKCSYIPSLVAKNALKKSLWNNWAFPHRRTGASPNARLYLCQGEGHPQVKRDPHKSKSVQSMGWGGGGEGGGSNRSRMTRAQVFQIMLRKKSGAQMSQRSRTSPLPTSNSFLSTHNFVTAQVILVFFFPLCLSHNNVFEVDYIVTVYLYIEVRLPFN